MPGSGHLYVVTGAIPGAPAIDGDHPEAGEGVGGVEEEGLGGRGSGVSNCHIKINFGA